VKRKFKPDCRFGARADSGIKRQRLKKRAIRHLLITMRRDKYAKKERDFKKIRLAQRLVGFLIVGEIII
jgi:hypothetical protein